MPSDANYWFPEFSAGRKAFGGALAGHWGEEKVEGSRIPSRSCCKMGEIVTKNTAEKVEVKRLAPARLTVSLVGPANGSHDFPPAAKRLAVLLLAIGVGRGRRGVAYPPDYAAKWAT